MKRQVWTIAACGALVVGVLLPNPWKTAVCLMASVCFALNGVEAYRRMRECDRRIAEIDADIERIKKAREEYRRSQELN